MFFDKYKNNDIIVTAFGRIAKIVGHMTRYVPGYDGGISEAGLLIQYLKGIDNDRYEWFNTYDYLAEDDVAYKINKYAQIKLWTKILDY